MKPDKKIIPLPFPIYAGTVMLLALVGLVVSGYLAVSHYRVYTDISYRSFCAVSKSINCDTVSQSEYSIFMGLPVPIWGVLGYVFLLPFIIGSFHQKAEKQRLWPVLFLLLCCYSCYSIVLAGISTFWIHSYCIMCIVTYGINFLLLFYVWLVMKRFGNRTILQGLRADAGYLWQCRKTLLGGVVLVIGVLFLLWGWLPEYWRMTPPPPSADIPRGVTADGHPWMGAENPKYTIIEFTDYQCFQCSKMHFFLRHLVAKNVDKVRLVHYHYPMDQEVNPIVKGQLHMGSGKLAMLAIFAGTQDKFWKMNDFLFDHARQMDTLDLKWLAEKVGLDHREMAASLYHPYIKERLKQDIWRGMKYRVAGTPTYIINGEKYSGQIPPAILRELTQ